MKYDATCLSHLLTHTNRLVSVFVHCTKEEHTQWVMHILYCHPPVKHIITLVKKLYDNVVEKHFVVLNQLHKLKERGLLFFFFFLFSVLEIPKDLFEMQGCLLFFCVGVEFLQMLQLSQLSTIHLFRKDNDCSSWLQSYWRCHSGDRETYQLWLRGIYTVGHTGALLCKLVHHRVHFLQPTSFISRQAWIW